MKATHWFYAQPGFHMPIKQTEAKPCPKCGRAPRIEKNYAWHVSCADCYDGAADARKQLHGYDDDSRDAAVEWWNVEVADFIEEQQP